MSPSTPVALALFSFISGLTGLIYEVVWARDLALSLGATAAAQAVVLAGFLGGLAAGSLLLGPRADKAERPLAFYGRIELLVALAGALSPLLLRGVERCPGEARWLFAFSAVALPAALMGAALPALCRAAAGPAALERVVGRLYAANCGGAFAGALLAAFALMPLVGIDGAELCAAALNALNGAAGLALSGRLEPPPAPRAAAGGEAGPPPVLVYVLVFALGFVSLTFEGVWTRALTLVLGPSDYSFAVMLAGFIGGLSVGGWLVARGRARARPAAAFAGASVLIALCALATPALWPRLPWLFSLANARVPATGLGFYELEGAKLFLCLLSLLPMTAALGLTLPLASRLAERGQGREGKTVGLVFAASSLGNVVGASSSLRLLPLLGLGGVLRSGSTVALVVGILALAAEETLSPGRRAAAALACALAVFGARRVLPGVDFEMLSLGDFRGRPAETDASFAAYRQREEAGHQLVYYKDGAESTVAVQLNSLGHLALKIDGKPDASTGRDMLTQLLLGHLPLLLDPGARDVMIVGLGSGVTAEAVLRHPVARLDVAELSPEVVAASPLFAQANDGALRDPRVVLHVGDARAYLGREPRAYDVIISEPSNPWVAGVGNLFTEQFLRLARSRLAEGGVMVQWFHLYEMDDDDVRLMLRTFRSVFPHVTLWTVTAQDVMLVGSRQPLAVDGPALERQWRDKALRDDLFRAQILTPAGLLSLQAAGEKTVAELAGSGPLNEDRFPRLEWAAPKAFFLSRSSNLFPAHDDWLDPERRPALYLEDYVKRRRRPLGPLEYADIVLFPHTVREKELLTWWIAQWRRAYPDDPHVAKLARLAATVGQ